VDVPGNYSVEASDLRWPGLRFKPSPQLVWLLAGSTRNQQAQGACGGPAIAANALAILSNATLVNA